MLFRSQPEQSLRLLWTQIDPLEISDFDLCLSLLLQCAEDQEEVPYIHAHLHAVRIVLAIGRITDQFDIGLCRIIHGWKCKRVLPIVAESPAAE